MTSHLNQPSFVHFPGFTSLVYPVPLRPYCSFNKRLVIIGGGAICSAFLPVIEKLVNIDWKKCTIIDVVDVKERFLHYARLGTQFVVERINQTNLSQILKKYLTKGDMLVELAYNLRTFDLLVWCQENDVFYFNTALYEWATVNHSGEFKETNHEDNNEFLRLISGNMEYVKHLNEKKKNSTTAILCHGANPGFVNHLLKQGLEDLTKQIIHDFPNDRNSSLLIQYLKAKDYANICKLSGVKIIQISEFDSQSSPIKKEKDTFLSSWNIPSFCEEAAAPAMFPLGSHEKNVFKGTKLYEFRGNRYAHLPIRAMNTIVRSWAPGIGDFYGTTPHHEETITMADFCTIRNHQGEVEYSPTVCFCYRPMDLACESLKEFERNNYKIQSKQIILRDEITGGRDNLGIFLLGHRYNGWWIGSLLSIEETRNTQAKGINATTLQVGASLAAAVCWAIQNPNAGIHFPESLPSDEILYYMKPWMGPWVSMPVNWTPHGETNPSSETWTFNNLMESSHSVDQLFTKPIRPQSAKL